MKGPAAPDALLTLGEENIYVEVESGSGDATRRMKKWRNQVALQGFVALAADGPDARIALVDEAKRVAKRGMATDLAHLEAKPDRFWIETW